VGFANGKHLVLINNGVIMGEGGISKVESATGLFVAPLPCPQIQTGDDRFGLRTNWFGFNLTGPSGQLVVVEASSSLLNPNWISVGTNLLTTGSAYFGDAQWTSFGSRFYRVRAF
jgi:hypothetical protein